jgi:trk system potassium uptake protein TrkH
MQKLLRESPLVRLFILGYFSCVIVGWLLLQLPLCQKNSVAGEDALFTAASALSTTGLATVDIGTTFSFLGQLVLLLLVQLGGIGYMVFSSFIVLSFEQKIVNFRKDKHAKAGSLSRDITLPGLVKQAITYTLICEMSGALLVYLFFRAEGGENSLWHAVFHSVSAFCTAGFSLFSSNLEGYKHHFGINVTLSLLSLLGAFGFLLSSERLLTLIARRITQSFATSVLLISGLLFLLVTPFAPESSGFQRLILSFFQVISTVTTAGFNTIDIKTLPQVTLLILIVLMLFGISLTGNGSNKRGTSFAALLRLMTGMLRSKKTTRLWSQKLLSKRIQIAISPFTHYLFVLSISFLLLSLIEKQPLLPLFFETASALCTVGLSMGITADLSLLGKSLIILLMLVGRTGILIFGFAISMHELSWTQEERQAPAL